MQPPHRTGFLYAPWGTTGGVQTLGGRIAALLAPLDPVSDSLQRALRGLFGRAPQPVRNLLDGTWLGAPLHPALTDIPIGASATAVALDALAMGDGDGTTIERTADAALAMAVLSGVPAATTGLRDWSFVRGEAKRIGTAHALLNATALVLYCLSLLARGAGRRHRGRVLAATGFGFTTLAAHLGGELSFRLGIRVNRTAFGEPEQEFVDVASEDDIPDTGVTGVTVGGVDVVVARVDGQVCAIAATCSHLGGPLARGERHENAIVCPWHASRFDLCSGEVINGPAVYPQPVYDVKVEHGRVSVRPSTNG
jgi:nitrite reductase/ring-hydroxylating ferredoxin subunit/uncharacterized membrane protein